MLFALVVFDFLLAVFTSAQINMKPEAPTSVWPVSIVTWLSAFLTLLLILDRLLTAWRGGQKPIYQKIDAQTAELKEEMARIRHDVERDMAVHRREIDKDMNGIGGRIAEVEKDANLVIAQNLALGERMTKSEADRIALWREFGQFREEMRDNHKEAVRAQRIARRQILEAIAQMGARAQQ